MQVADVKEVKKTSSETEVNFLIEQGWRLLSITQVGASFQYLLVRGE